MRSLVKKSRITVRLTAEQARKLAEAAHQEARRRGELVDESTLLRELGMAGVERLLQKVA